MFKRVAKLFESVVYAGLKPDQKRAEGKLQSRTGWLDRYLDGGKPQDPLYLSNQTTWQKCRRPLLIMLPLVLIAAIVALSSAKLIHKKTAPQAEPTPAEVAARSLTFKDLKLDTRSDVQILEAAIRVQKGSRILIGKAQNNTDRVLALVDIVFEITDTLGSQLGRHHVILHDLAPRSTTAFESPVKPQDAAEVVVVEIQTK